MGTTIIAGGTGFIGKHLCEQLSLQGKEAKTFSRNPDLEFLKNHAASVSGHAYDAAEDLRPLLKDASTLIYLASSSTPATDNASLELEFENNILPAAKVIEMSLAANPEIHVIYLSSGGTVYGESQSSPITESAPVKPNSMYANGKIAVENYLRYLSRVFPNYCYTILRPSNPVGKWSQSRVQGFINVALTSVSQNSPIIIYGDGNVVRDYICANDLVDAIIMTAENRAKSSNKVWNVGSGVGHSLNDILASIQRLAGIEIQIDRRVSRHIEIPYNVLDSTAIRHELGWVAKTDIDGIILRAWSEMTLN